MRHIRQVFLEVVLTAGILLCAGVAVTPATAAPVDVRTFHFTGIVDNPAGFVFGSNQLTGSFAFDPGTPNSTPSSSQFGVYSNAISHLDFTIGSYSSTTNDSPIIGSSIIVGNNNFDYDQYLVSTPISAGQLLTPLSFEISLLLGQQLGNTFNNTLLPTNPPSIAPHPIGDPGNPFTPFRIVFDNGTSPDLVVSGRIQLITTPLPPAVILFGAGLVALIGLGARNWRQRKEGLAVGLMD